MTTRTEHARLIVALGALAVGLMLLLVVPAMASANAPAATAPPAAQEEAPTATEGPAADQPADETAPADETTPADEILQPAPPPAPTEPETSAPAPAPAGDPQPTPPLSTGTPTAPEAPASEAAPEGHATTIVLPAVSGLPSSMKGAPVIERTVSADPPPAAAAPTLIPIAPPSSPPDPPTAVAAPSRTRAHPAQAPPRSNFVEALGGVDRSAPDALTRAREIGPGPAGASAEDDHGANPFATLAAPGGPAPRGSSLLAVLAGYIIPGGGLPTTTLLLFVQLAVILAAFYAPRSGIGERIHAPGRLGPRLGYRTVLARPG
ncbi:MAG TPA: hypothetical protein VK904_00850 [Miltoncostaeaceae bacterium]|nr:hypothetical protein [Miltoncostaeaceae bacterium]